jgi:hypothetical protein
MAQTAVRPALSDRYVGRSGILHSTLLWRPAPLRRYSVFLQVIGTSGPQDTPPPVRVQPSPRGSVPMDHPAWNRCFSVTPQALGNIMLFKTFRAPSW